MDVTIHVNKSIGLINPNLHGHFAEHLGELVYEGLWVGLESHIPNIRGIRTDVIAALQKLQVPVLRWPGGCFADDYHWHDGIGPRESRPRRLNLHWDGEESNHFGTHEFLDLCEQLGTNPYISMNLGSGSVQEMREWVEYLNSSRNTTLTQARVKNGHPKPYEIYFLGIGNENWGCGGNMSPQFYANEYLRYATYVHSFNPIGMYKIASGPNSSDYRWTYNFFRTITGWTSHWKNRIKLVNGFAMHYYCGTAGTATEYSIDQWYQLLFKAMKMNRYILNHRHIMDLYDPQRRVDLIVDEWGTWHPPLPGTKLRWLKQQNTIRDALVAAITLDIFHRNANIAKMANIAQIVNVLQSMILTEGDHILTTPTYHIFEMYRPHQDGTAVPIKFKVPNIRFSKGWIPQVFGSCSRKGKILTLSLVNAHVTEKAPINLRFRGIPNSKMISWRALYTEDIHDHNTFEHPTQVEPKNETVTSDKFQLAPASVNILQFEI